MDYKKHYNRLVERAGNRTLDGYTEAHHIIPKCMGGIDEDENMVRLTPEEHYVAHQLLIKMFPKNGALVFAANMMTITSTHNDRSKNKCYGWVKRKFVVECKARKGKKNHRYGTMWITNGKESKTIKKDDQIPKDWRKGRVIKEPEPKQPSKYEIANNELLTALRSATSISQALRSLGLQCRGNNYTRAKRLIVEHRLQDRFEHPYIVWTIGP